MKTLPSFPPTSISPRNLSLAGRFACMVLLAMLVAPLTLRAGTNASAWWTGGAGAADQNWSTAANWAAPQTGVVAPPYNPMTPWQDTLGNGAGDIDFYAGGGTPATSTCNVDVPWKIAVLYVGNNRNANLYGQDLTIQQGCLGGDTLVLSSAAIQIQPNNQAHTLNITNNVIFDDSFYTSNALYVGHSIVQNVGNCTLNFYGHFSNPGSNGWFIVRSCGPVNFFGGLDASLTPNAADPNIGLWNVNIGMRHPTASVAPAVSFPKANNSWKYMNVDRGTIIIGTNNALPVASWFWFGDTPGRPVVLTMNNWDQTFEAVFDTGGTATQARTIDTGSGVGGTLTINDNGLTNDWAGILMTGTGRLVKNGPGKLIIEQNQTYTGGTTIGGGILQLGVSPGVTAGTGLLASSGNITNNGTLIINCTNAFTLAGNLRGTGGLQKLAANTVTLNGVNSYSGNTFIGGGTVVLGSSGALTNSPAITLANGATLNASAAGGVTRTSGQSLNGSGVVLGDVAAQPGSIVTVGNSFGTLTLSNNATLDTTTLNMELSGDPATIGGGVNDLLSVSNTLTLANTSTIFVTPVFALDTATPYKIIKYGTLSGTPANLTAALPYTGRYTFTVQDSPPYLQLAVASKLSSGYLFWTGGNSGDPTRWDVTTTNWINGASPDKFIANDPVTFDDSAVTNRATLTGSIVAASLVASNNSLSYTLDGTGSLTANSVVQQGSGSSTIANSAANSLGIVQGNSGILALANTGENTFASLTANGGSVVISNGAANSFGAIAMNSGSVTIANSGANSLGVVQANGGTLTLANAGQDTFTSLTANGGSVVISNGAPNSFGPITVTSGSVTIANNAANTYTTSYTSLTVAGGTLAFNQPTNVTVAAVIAGAGTVAKNGANTLTLLANNLAFTGNMQINNGVLKAGVADSLGDGSATIVSGATLDVNGLIVGRADVTVQGAGQGGLGAIRNTGVYQPFALTNITLAGDVSFGGGWETIKGAFVGGGFKVTKVGLGDANQSTNDCYIGSMSATDIGDVEVQTGLLGFENAGTTMGRPANTVTVRNNAALVIYACLTAGNKQFVMDDGSRILGGGGASASAFGGTMNLNGTVHAGLLSATSLITYNGTMTGTGSFSLDTTGTFVLAGENIHTGGIVVTNGALRVIHPLALSSNMTVVVKTNGLSGSGQVVGNNVPRLELSDGVVIPPGVTVHLNSAGTGDNRNTFGVATTTTNEYQGTLIPHGDGTICLVANAAGSVLKVTGPTTNLDFVGTLNLRGAGTGVLSGPIRFNGNLGHNPNSGTGLWTISSTSNQWSTTTISSSRLLLGTNNALCTTAPVSLAAIGTLDLGGFNQTVPSIDASGGAGVIGNSSATADSVLTLNGATNVSTITNNIVNVITTGTRAVALTITNTTVRLFGTNTYTGPTLVKNVGVLGGTGKLASAVTVESGGSLAPGASIGTLTITSNLVLSAGSSNVFEVNIDTLAHDMVVGLSNVTYGGTLVIVSNGGFGAAITNGASVKLFNALTYSGAFAAIVPVVPAPGFEWNTNALTTTGTLGIKFAPVAVNDTVARAGSTPLKILKSTLLANDIGTPLSVQSTDAFSTNNAAITTDATFVYYNPVSLTPVHNVTDRFNYTITDGVFTSVGAVTVNILPAPTNATHNITGISTNGDGNYTISFAGIPGQTYVVEATTNLVTSVWTPLNTNIAGTNGLWNFTDLEATNYPSRFYRTATP